MSADELKEAKVTQVIQDVRVLPSGAAARPAAVNDDVRQGTAVRTGIQSRSELTFKDQTITRLSEKTIYSPGGGVRTIDLGSGQFLLYVPKKSGGAKVKDGTRYGSDLWVNKFPENPGLSAIPKYVHRIQVRVKSWEMIADNLSKACCSCSASAIDSNG